jgi:hypothetical protein
MSRTLTIVAIAFLTFDGAVLAVLGLLSGRLVLVPVGLAFFASAGLILIYWRWYQRRLKEITAARHELSDDARALRASLRGAGESDR